MKGWTRNWYPWSIVVPAFLVTTLACSLFGAGEPEAPPPEETPAEVSEPEAPTKEPTPTEVSAPTSSPIPSDQTAAPTRQSLGPTPTMRPGPTPKSGTGNLMGRIIWNSQGVAGSPVILCEEISRDFGCLGESHETETDEGGVYVFTDLPPGDYALATKSVDTDGGWLYLISGFFTSAKYPVESGETTNLGDLVLTKTDIVLLSPGDQEKMDDPRPTLRWEAYPGAASYILTVSPSFMTSFEAWLETNEYRFEEDLPNCKYFWYVDVYNAYQEKIVDGAHGSFFYVEDQTISCELEGLSPSNKSSVSGPTVTLTWDSHPLAAYYQVWFAEGEYGGGEVIAGHVKTTETTYTSPNLKPGIYVWEISVFDKDGQKVGGMDFRNVTVK